jgi:hypothetical protein
MTISLTGKNYIACWTWKHMISLKAKSMLDKVVIYNCVYFPHWCKIILLQTCSIITWIYIFQNIAGINILDLSSLGNCFTKYWLDFKKDFHAYIIVMSQEQTKNLIKLTVCGLYSTYNYISNFHFHFVKEIFYLTVL